MKRYRQIVIVLAILVLLGCIGFFSALHLARDLVANEGYDTDEGAWNYVVRSGEIRFQLLEESKLIELVCSGKKGVISSQNEGYVKLGYGAFSPTLSYDNPKGERKVLTLYADKFNNWNRVRYVEQEDGGFIRYDNGVLQDSDQQ